MEKTRNIIGAVLLLFIILTVSVGGYFFMKYMTTEQKETTTRKDNKKKKDIRIDVTKDYLYYENAEEFLEEAEIEKQDVIFNFTSQKDLNNSLHQELENLYNNVTYIKDNNIPKGTEYIQNDKGIYSVMHRDYLDNSYGDYVSLVVLDFKFDVINGSIINKIKGYVIKKSTGELLTPEVLMETFNVTENIIIEKVKKRLNDSQVLEEGETIIDIEGTIKSIMDNDYYQGVKTLSISKNGKLTINFIVKTNEINYNDSVELN